LSTAIANVKTVSYLGSPLAVESWEIGSADPPMLVLHGGNGFDPEARFVQDLARSRRVIGVSHPGWGESQRPEWLDTVSDLAHFYLELLESENLDDVTVLGHSTGGWIAAEMAVWRPQRIGRLVLVDPVGIRVGGPADRDIVDIFAISREERIKLGFHDPSLAGPPLAEMDDEKLRRQLQADEMMALYYWDPYMCNPKLRRRLAAIQTPCQLIWGRHDGVAPLDYGRAYAESLGHARLHVVEEAAHCPQIERPEEFCRIVEAFIAETSAPR
jgi:pimeloyl-ACP methyl ester carboxylesterase